MPTMSTATLPRRRILCGNCHHHHDSVEAVRGCCAGSDIWACTWLVDRGYTEDGDKVIRDCGADSWNMPDGRGYECSRGHSHVHEEVRWREGWDYASDALEAEMMRRNGLGAVGPDGGSI